MEFVLFFKACVIKYYVLDDVIKRVLVRYQRGELLLFYLLFSCILNVKFGIYLI